MPKLSPGTLTKVVATAGSPEALSSASLKVSGFTLAHQPGNTGAMKLGPSGSVTYVVDAGTSFHSEILSGDSANVEYFDLSEWFLDVNADGEGAEVLYVKR